MSLRVDLEGNGTGFKQMLDSAKTQAKSFGNSVTHEIGTSWGGIGKSLAAGLAGIFTVEGLKSGLEWFIHTGNEIKDTAEQVNMSTDSWQKWSDAVDRAGLSTGGFMRIVETLRQKFTDALTDPKARGELSRLGFSDEEITGGFSDENLKRALENANGGDQKRKYLSDVIGNRGLKYSTVLDELPHSQALFSTDDINDAKETERTIKSITKEIGKAGLSAVEFFRFWYQQSTKTKKELDMQTLNSGQRLGKYADPEALAEQARRDKEQAKNKLDGLLDSLSGKNSADTSKDPMDAKLDAQREEQALHQQERQQRLDDSRRSLMTIGDRRASIAGEMPGLRKQIAERSSKMNGEDFLTDAQKNELEGVTGKARTLAVNALKQKYQDQTDSLQLRLNKDTLDLKEKPLDFHADSMSKVGLYSASSVAFNPLLGVAQKTNQLLTQIVQNTSPHIGGNLKDPHAP